MRTRGFFADLVSDNTGGTLHRWQIVVWTVIIALIFLWLTYNTLEMPELPTTLLTLMGISGTLYVGFKFPETQS